MKAAALFLHSSLPWETTLGIARPISKPSKKRSDDGNRFQSFPPPQTNRMLMATQKGKCRVQRGIGCVGRTSWNWLCGCAHTSALVWCVHEGSTVICVVVTMIPWVHFLGTAEAQRWRTATANKSCFNIPAFLAFSTVGLIIMEDS